MAIVAEIADGTGSYALIGVGRLVANVDHTEAEYAVIVIDEYQNKGLGSLLTDYCENIAKKWGIKELVAETAQNNRRMLSLFNKKRFVLHRTMSSDIVLCRKEI